MSNEIKINVPERIVYNDNVVLLTKQIVEFYGADFDTVKHNFSRNKQHFVEGKHYYRLVGKALSDFKNKVSFSPLVGKNAKVLYLWTKRGAMFHAKILKTDMAWKVFEFLVDNYFDKQQIVKIDPNSVLDPDLIIALATQLKEARQQLEIAKPKAKYYDEVLDSSSLIKITTIAKEYGLSGQGLNRLLYAWEIQYPQGDTWVLYQEYADKGYAFYEDFPYIDNDGTQQTRRLLKWTQKGREFLHKVLTSHGHVRKIKEVQK